MKGKLKQAIPILIILLLIIGMEILLPKPVSWTLTLSSDDTIPYGTAALSEVIQDLFDPTPTLTRSTIYEGKDSLSGNHLVLAHQFGSDNEDVKALISQVRNGSNTIIASTYFDFRMLDTLEIDVNDEVLSGLQGDGGLPTTDSSYLFFPQKPDQRFFYQSRDVSITFDLSDTTDWSGLLMNEHNRPVLIGKAFGKGHLYLSTTPQIFTNLYLLSPPNQHAAAQALSLLPRALPLYWSEFYSRGRGEAQTPLRYILSESPLRWAYFLLISVLIIYVFIDSKRRQRAIPVVAPPPNDSINFINTLGDLYFERKDHKRIFQKKVTVLFDYIRTHYRLNPVDANQQFLQTLAAKSGNPLLNVEGLFTMIAVLEDKNSIEDQELLTFNRKVEAFFQTDQ